jgi:ubiquinone/menaquinone biosynthesis C-methylase UbiE
MMQTPEETDWDRYYADAEPHSQRQFDTHFFPELHKLDLSVVLDFACGRGRIAQHFLPHCRKMILIDVNREALDFCKQRLTGNTQYATSLDSVLDSSVTFLYSWDAMVHFDVPRLVHYFGEFGRVLAPGGIAMIHHSNLVCGADDWLQNVHCRAKVSAADVRKICDNFGLQVTSQKLIAWGEAPNLDCITMFIGRTP